MPYYLFRTAPAWKGFYMGEHLSEEFIYLKKVKALEDLVPVSQRLANSEDYQTELVAQA